MVLDYPMLELQETMSHPMQLLGTKLESSTRIYMFFIAESTFQTPSTFVYTHKLVMLSALGKETLITEDDAQCRDS